MGSRKELIIHRAEVTAAARSRACPEGGFSKDYWLEVRTIREKLKELEILNESKVVIISGTSGTGKSLLASVLHSVIHDSKLIEMLDYRVAEMPIDMESHFNIAPEGIYIVDGLEFATKESALAVIEEMVATDCSVIIFTQTNKDLKCVKAVRFALTRSGLSEK